MKFSPDVILALVTIVCFVVGYFIVSRVLKGFGRRESDAGRRVRDEGRAGRDGAPGRREYGRQSAPAPGRPDLDLENRYATILELRGQVNLDDIEDKYKELLARYSPDKVEQLEPRFRRVAEEKRKAIIEAYEYFRRKYGS